MARANTTSAEFEEACKLTWGQWGARRLAALWACAASSASLFFLLDVVWTWALGTLEHPAAWRLGVAFGASVWLASTLTLWVRRRRALRGGRPWLH